MNTPLHRSYHTKRWLGLLNSDLRLNSKRYLIILLGAFVVGYLALLMSMRSITHYESSGYITVFMFGLIGLGFFAGSAFQPFNHQTTTADYLLLPASSFEKLLAQILIYVVLGSLCYLLIFWIDAHLARWTALAIAAAQSKEVVIDLFRYAMLWKDMALPLIIWMVVIAIGFYLFALRLFFKRYAFVKSVLVLFCTFGLWYCFMVGLSHLFFSETEGFMIHIPDYKTGNGLYLVEIYVFVMACCVWLTAFPLAYYKLKEKTL
ncbi:MAG: hypothetical protein FWG54_06000 [Bacteroidetes bacterium]|nr:hypothetical protein [Bacteroidota bacterium]